MREWGEGHKGGVRAERRKRWEKKGRRWDSGGRRKKMEKGVGNGKEKKKKSN